MLERWTKNRELAKKAECKSCAAARGMKTHEPKRRWLQATYKCCKCKAAYEPKNFAYGTLAALEEDKQTFLAVCLHCNPVLDETHASLKPVRCVACKKLKERKEFSFERQRCKNYATWRCKECDFPRCDTCGIKPSVPKKSPYRCEKCMFPPCSCGTPRPSSTKYRSTNVGMKTWKCPKCRGT